MKNIVSICSFDRRSFQFNPKKKTIEILEIVQKHDLSIN